MTENDYIAEYIKERYPKILSSFDYVAWKINKMWSNAMNALAKELRKVDWSKLDSMKESEVEK